MDWLTFTSHITQSIAWPVAAVLIVTLLRGEISKIVPFFKKVNAGPVVAEFERDVKELKASILIPALLNGSPPAETASKGFLFQLAELHPRSAILESWVRVEAAARAALFRDQNPGTMSTYLPASHIAEPLMQQKVFSPNQVTLFDELRRLRNDVAHAQSFEPTKDSA